MCFGRLRSEPIAGMMSAYGAEIFVTTVYESGAETSIGLPLTSRRSWIDGWSFESYATSNENNTSADVIGWPSENAAPRRRCQVHVRPSGLTSHDLASSEVVSWV